MIEELKKVRQHLLTGVSFAIPFIACGGIMIAIAIALAPMTSHGPDFSHSPIANLIQDIGSASFALMLPVLGGYIAYSIANKPGLVPGFVGGFLSGEVKAGFLGALLAGLIAGYVVALIKRLPVPRYIRPIMPILVIPILASSIVGVVMLKVLGVPIAHVMASATNVLRGMSAGNNIVLGLLLGAMIAFDMGGPINKTAFFFGAAMLKEGEYHVMGACAAAICIPPLGLGLATLLARKLWSEEEREAGIAGITMGLTGITEGAIPFAASDPLRVIPCIMAGSMVGAAIAMFAGVGDSAPHGGLIVLFVVSHRVAYVLAILTGTLVTAVSINVLKFRSKAKVVAKQERTQ